MAPGVSRQKNNYFYRAGGLDRLPAHHRLSIAQASLALRSAQAFFGFVVTKRGQGNRVISFPARNQIFHTFGVITLITHYDASRHVLGFLVADDGMGVQASLTENEKYALMSEPEALKMCIKDAIRRQGDGIWLIFHIPACTGCRIDI